jgi:hypothetical protein
MNRPAYAPHLDRALRARTAVEELREEARRNQRMSELRVCLEKCDWRARIDYASFRVTQTRPRAYADADFPAQFSRGATKGVPSIFSGISFFDSLFFGIANQ